MEELEIRSGIYLSDDRMYLRSQQLELTREIGARKGKGTFAGAEAHS